jgi:hypothetical protein
MELFIWSWTGPVNQDDSFKPDSHMSPTSAMPLFEISEEEHRQKILLINDQRQWASPTSATYENQALIKLLSRLDKHPK